MLQFQPPSPKMEIAAAADRFRRVYFPGARGRIRLEPVVEHQLGIEIVPRPGLTATTGVRGYLTMNGARVYVDEEFMLTQPLEYQALLAHETAHHDRHRHLLPESAVRSAAEYAAFHDAFSEQRWANLEWQARTWASHVLMPGAEFSSVFLPFAEAARDMFPDLEGPAKPWVASRIANYFGVTTARAEHRMNEDKWWRAARLESRVIRPLAREDVESARGRAS